MNLKEIQQSLADKQAKNVILAMPVTVVSGKVWRNCDLALQPVHWEVKYLRMRGMLEHNPTQPHLVAIRGLP